MSVHEDSRIGRGARRWGRVLVLAVGIGAGLPAPSGAAGLSRAEVRDAVFLSVQSGLQSVAGRALNAAAARIAAGTPALAALLRERQDRRSRLEGLQKELAAVVGTSGIDSDETAQRVTAEIEAARARIAEIDRRLHRDFPQFQELTDPAPLSRPDLQALLRPGEAVVMTLTDAQYTYVWAVSRTRAGWHRAAIGRDQLAADVRSLRAQLSGRVATRSAEALDEAGPATVPPFDRATAHALYSALLAPLEPVLRGTTHLMAVTDGPLTSLPLALLVTRPPLGSDTSAADLRATDWLVRSYALTTLPSVSSLRVLRRAGAAPRKAGRRVPFAGFGDPRVGYAVTEGATGSDPLVHSRGVYGEVAEVAALAPLPNTARELRALARAAGGDTSHVLLGEAATERAVKTADLGAVSVLAFATHGLLANGLPGLEEPALVFTPPARPDSEDDALLTASEAAQLHLSADLVILSACNTAGTDGRPGADGLSGLAKSFIYAGARAVLVSHWPVDDYAAAELTTGMLAAMRDGKVGRAEALRRSMLALMSDPTSPANASPRMWAPFVVAGEGGRDR